MVRSDLIAFFLAVSSLFFAQESKAQEYKVEGNTLVDSNDNILYEIIEGSFTWQEAKVDAEFRGGHLATITSLEEQQTVELLTRGDFYWLGATDEQSEGVWEWVTGEPFDFTYWHPGEPNHSGDHMWIWGGGYWDDVSPNYRPSYIIEYDIFKPTLVITAFTSTKHGFSATFRGFNLTNFVLDPDLIEVLLDGQDVSDVLEIVKDGHYTRINYASNTVLNSGSKHILKISAVTSSSLTIITERSFTVPAYVTVPSTLGLTGVDTSKPGFLMYVKQSSFGLVNNTLTRLDHLADDSENVADDFGSDSYTWTVDVINFDQEGNPQGKFRDSGNGDSMDVPDDYIPGIPGFTGSTDNITAMIETVVRIPEAGFYTFGFNSDDGFLTTVGNDLASQVRIGEFSGGRAASTTEYSAYFEAAGDYPMQSLWYEGGGDASLEWFTIYPTKALLNDTANGGIETFAALPSVPARVISMFPRDGAASVSPDADISVVIEDSTQSVDIDSVTLAIDGIDSGASATKDGGTTTITVINPEIWASGQQISATLAYAAGGVDRTVSWSWTVVSYPTLGKGITPVNTGIEPGFEFRVYQTQSSRGNNHHDAELQLLGLWGNGDGNFADPSGGEVSEDSLRPGVLFEQPDTINMSHDGYPAGQFFDRGDGTTGDRMDDYIPGIPGITGSADFIAAEIMTYIEFPTAGYYEMFFNSDDGFRVSEGHGTGDNLGLTIGSFNGGRGAADTRFGFEVEESGLYPIRVLWYQGQGPSNLEWSSMVNGERVLINDVDAGGLKAYRTRSGSPIDLIDGDNPTISLIGNTEIKLEVGIPYSDPGYYASDAQDGPIDVQASGTVDVNTLGSYQLTYNATDSEGNAAEPVYRVVNIVDKTEDLTPPVITLNGSSPLLHSPDTNYEDAGALAIDNVDGVVAVTTTGTVDPNTLGVYTLTYSATDAAGNAASVTREVTVGLLTTLSPQSASGMAGSEVVVPFTVNGFNAISGLQFSLQWDPQVMTLVLDEHGLPKLTQSATILLNDLNFPLILGNNFSVSESGKLTFLWDEAVQPGIGRTLDDDGILFALHFNLVGDPGSTTQLVIGNDPTPYKIVPASGEEIHEEASVGTVEILNTIVISGRVTLFGDGQTPVPGVRIQVDVDNRSHEMLTGEDGYYQMTLTPGSNYSLHASLDTDLKANQGVDVSDIIYLRKHILNREKLNSTMAWLAADTNRDNSIDVGDIVAIRKIILNRSSHYSTDSNGEAENMFRFARLNFKDVDPLLSFTELPEALTMKYQSVSGDLSGADFAAVKLGDANGDWTPPAGGGNPLNAMAGRIPLSQGDATIGFGSSWSDEDGSIHVALNASASKALMGLELELSWDKDMLELEGMSSDALSHFTQGVHSHEGSASVKIAWDDATLTGTTLNGNEPLMTYRFRRVGEGSTGLFLEQALLAGENSVLGRMQSAALFLGSGNRSRAGLNGAIKSIEHRDNQIELWVDTRGASSWQLESSPTLEASQWQPLQVLGGARAWQQVVIPHTSETHFLRLVPVTGAEL